MSGQVSYLAGLSAEDIVARRYEDAGRRIVARRWRGTSGEVDLIAKDGEGFIFIEVKKSRSHRQAAARLSRCQMNRIYGSASEFLSGQPNGQNTDTRFDVALVDAGGAVALVENAIGF